MFHITVSTTPRECRCSKDFTTRFCISLIGRELIAQFVFIDVDKISENFPRLREFVLYPNLEKMTREKFKFDFPPLKEISQKTSLMLINTDDAIDVPEPLQPNMIQVGGLQITDTKPLPQVILAHIKLCSSCTKIIF